MCVQEGQPLHSLQAFAVFPNWPPLFFCTESAFLISPSHPPLPVAADFLAGRQALEPGGSAGPQVRGGKAGGAEMLALHLAGVEALFLNMPSEVRSLGHFFFFCAPGPSPTWKELWCPAMLSGLPLKGQKCTALGVTVGYLCPDHLN